MSSSRRDAARDRAQHRSAGEVWIDHAALDDADIEWIQDVEQLTLWNVSTPEGFLGRLPKLWLLDVRGGSGADLSCLAGCSRLRGLTVNQVRGLGDLTELSGLTTLEYIQLYGLKQVERLPSLAALTRLRRIDVGQMRGIQALGGLLDAPGLEEVFILRWAAVTTEDIATILAHPRIRAFDWFGENVPSRRWVPVVEKIGLPKARPVLPLEWFELEK